jgi:hypothetical protein
MRDTGTGRSVNNPGLDGSEPNVSPTASRATEPIESVMLQVVALALGVVAIGMWHWPNDGLWFQGDAPRHAANGLFVWDLLTTLPRDPIAFTLEYYARYPVIVPLVYPPLFYVAEGLAFWVTTPSPLVAKTLVLACAALGGFYTMLWARRWLSPAAGWAGACVVLLPGFVRYSNAVLLNIPATALGMAALYHLRAWLDMRSRRDGRLFTVLAVATLLTYYPGAIILPLGLLLMLFVNRRAWTLWLWLVPTLILASIIALATVFPVHLARNIPSLPRLLTATHWQFYLAQLSSLMGGWWLYLGGAGLVCALASRRWRKEAMYLAIAYPTVAACLVLLPAMSERYALLLGPVTVLAAFLGGMSCLGVAGRWRIALMAALIVGTVSASVSAAFRTPVPRIAGFDAVAEHLRREAPNDAVLYSGRHDGVFGFYARALDPHFDRRVVLSSRVLYRFAQRADFKWVETPHAATVADVVSLIQRQSGCRWIAVEIGPELLLPESERLLRRALEGPEFVRVGSFPVDAGAVIRVDLYRVDVPVDPVTSIDLVFPSFSDRVFRAVEPIERRD